MLVQILTAPREDRSAGVAAVSAAATALEHHGGMIKSNIGKARWARGKADDLHRQARELEQDRSGDWEARARRRRAAGRLRAEAARFESIAWRFDPTADDQAA